MRAEIQTNFYPTEYRPMDVNTFLTETIKGLLLRHTETLVPEIELRRGLLLDSKTRSKVAFSNEVLHLSGQNPVIIRAEGENSLRLPAAPLLDARSCYFEPSLSELEFLESLELMYRYIPEAEQWSEVSVDFAVKKGGEDKRAELQRISWDVAANTFSDSSKLGKQNIDLLHKKIVYRLTTCLETSRAASAEDLARLPAAESARVKSRLNFGFLGMTFSFTTAWKITSRDYSQSGLRGMVELAQTLGRPDRSETPEEAVSRVLAIAQLSKVYQSFEVELELTNQSHLLSFLGSNNLQGFDALVKRFFRNFELLNDRSILSRDYHDFLARQVPPGSAIDVPAFGNYLPALVRADLSGPR